MNSTFIQDFCSSLKAVQQEIKWDNDLCFTVGKKMFCIMSLDEVCKISIKVKPELFDELLERNGIIPAPYLARNKWIQIVQHDVFTSDEWKHYLLQSYELIIAKLTKKEKEALNI